VTRTVVVGIGNTFRHDDGVGLVVARALRLSHLPHVSIRESDGDGCSLLEMMRDADRAILVDATSSGLEPGTVSRLEPSDSRISQIAPTSSHAFGLRDALGMGATLGVLPASVVIYGIEGLDFSPGRGLSAPVRKAAASVIREIVAGLPVVET
jgi:hydrogenase maturation protease